VYDTAKSTTDPTKVSEFFAIAVQLSLQAALLVHLADRLTPGPFRWHLKPAAGRCRTSASLAFMP
jgi:hypothetical protein